MAVVQLKKALVDQAGIWTTVSQGPGNRSPGRWPARRQGSKDMQTYGWKGGKKRKEGRRQDRGQSWELPLLPFWPWGGRHGTCACGKPVPASCLCASTGRGASRAGARCANGLTAASASIQAAGAGTASAACAGSLKPLQGLARGAKCPVPCLADGQAPPKAGSGL